MVEEWKKEEGARLASLEKETRCALACRSAQVNAMGGEKEKGREEMERERERKTGMKIWRKGERKKVNK